MDTHPLDARPPFDAAPAKVRRRIVFLLLVLHAVLSATAQETLHSWVGEAGGDALGHAVAGAGDLDGDGRADLLVGAPNHDGAPGEESGRVYAYSGATGALLHAWEGDLVESRLGYALAGGADLDGDAVPEVVLGAPGSSYAGWANRGRVLVYSGATDTLLWGASGELHEALGKALALVGDLDGDGLADVLAGAPGDAWDDAVTGSVRLHAGRDGRLLARWQGDGERFEQFGIDVAGGGDLDGDGRPDVVVGTEVGRAHAFSGRTGAPLHTWSVEDDRGFGEAVAAAPDLDRDGRAEALVGEPRYTGEEFEQGRVLAFSGATGAEVQSWLGDERGDWLGTALAQLEDVDADGVPDLAFGAPGLTGLNSGGVAVHSGATGERLWMLEGGLSSEKLGSPVAPAGDVDGDGLSDLIAGAPSYGSFDLEDQGRAAVFSGRVHFTTLGPCLAHCPEPEIALQLRGGNPAPTPARVELRVVAPRALELASGELPTGPFAVDLAFAAPAGAPPGEACPVDLDFETTLTWGDGEQEVAGFRVQAIAAGPVGEPGVRSEPPPVIRSWEGEHGDDFFGDAVASVGDVDGDGVADVGIGAPGPDGFPWGPGHASVYSGATGAQLWRWDGDTDRGFLGTSLAAAGDVDGDGRDDVVVGAPNDVFNPTGPGAAFVYSGATGALLRSWSGERTGDQFGYRVAGAADLDGDGLADVAVTAPSYDGSAGISAGIVYAYSGGSGDLLWRREGDANSDRLGRSLAIVADADRDGVAEVAVGAPGVNGASGLDVGRVSIFSGARSHRIAAVDGDATGELGATLAAVGDTDGDGVAELVAGAPSYDGAAGSRSGRVLLLSARTAEVLRSWDGENASDSFGLGVGGAGDVDGDGVGDVLVGTSNYRGDEDRNLGKAYVYAGRTGGLLWAWEGDGGTFGLRLAGAGDADGNGRDDVLVGAPTAATDVGFDVGRVYLYSGSDLYVESRGTCRVACPDGTLLVRLEADNTTDSDATLTLELVEPDVVELRTLVVPPGPFAVVESIGLDELVPSAATCPTQLIFAATLTTADGRTRTDRFAAQAVRTVRIDSKKGSGVRDRNPLRDSAADQVFALCLLLPDP